MCRSATVSSSAVSSASPSSDALLADSTPASQSFSATVSEIALRNAVIGSVFLAAVALTTSRRTNAECCDQARTRLCQHVASLCSLLSPTCMSDPMKIIFRSRRRSALARARRERQAHCTTSTAAR
eukprot:CAMPEP_0180019044 /NCGR_PEP_ID=MMETSP0984-20121128/20857_1 /TAXON_ID=483367 /ORGANISM="non described non described, Strain CCMP 2436" /LENGTH=125 /DNA_ID=CAMNT_0021942473 /DNA_START=607 /DNA_END=984 /DNA_ORIENTATION=-